MPKKDNYETWFDVKKKKPPTYELVQIAYEDGSRSPAWWNGFGWESGREIKDLKIVEWKRLYILGLSN